MRHLSGWRHGVQPACPFEAAFGTAVMGAFTVATWMTRTVSTAPPLSLLSWSVDGAGHTHRRRRRRLSMQERIPLLCSTIREAAPDIVALQDSLPEVAEALCCRSTPGKISELHGENTGPELATAIAGDIPQYEQVGAVRNGRCGYLQLFRRCDSLWAGRLLLSCPSLTAEFVSTIPSAHDAASSKAAKLNSEAATTAVVGGGVRFVLTNVDLSYRGKSLAVGEKPLASPDVSVNGSPFTLRVTPGTSASQRVRGQLDSHREAALAFFSQVARPDVLLGTFFMGRDESMPGYDDAWVLAGAPAEHERTINTFFRHKHDMETNFFYFMPPELHGARAVDVSEAFPAADAPVGTRIPLNARRRVDAAGSHIVEGATNAFERKRGEGDAAVHHAEVQQLAGRFQRCFFRCLPSRHHKQQLPLCRRYERRQLVVLKPFTDVTLTAGEAAAQGRGGEKVQARCSAADGYPILVLLS
ncbi:hypothetical protein TraAM80_05760 [Trypanosoma rangeli]|uniref:Endonuclease/exonuclease/phosphatase domain-containing protein n=1 Tax=Trypanosoma rangeli TaxID=5698 RepID=A0A422ND21_TRYRA|nr:uncharacterized protein TraAM80_05760 [Trypanosoma rangeli]RNF03397.1 hypothetical protein TraAM80_05760 [Trypanosoma rangeli]|eukprot:RNF03397.1 hypothetical protein TraAM80_05760 [Trypanosoma rangeli]